MIVLVNKRVNQRFFSYDGNNGTLSKLGNPQPGTIIDSDIVTPEIYDFYLISQ